MSIESRSSVRTIARTVTLWVEDMVVDDKEVFQKGTALHHVSSDIMVSAQTFISLHSSSISLVDKFGDGYKAICSRSKWIQ